MSDIIGYKVDGEIVDSQSITKEQLTNAVEIHLSNSPESLEILRHSCAHLMAQAIKAIWPEAKFFVGPNVEDGFYYDFKVDSKVGEEDLARIEAKMQEIAEVEISKYEITKQEAVKKFANDDLKLEVLTKIPSETVSIYKQGEFEDLCRGPHLPNTKFLKHFKLTRIAGAFLGGDDTKEMLTRIYGIAFADKKALKEYLTFLEEAKKRDHRKLGNDLDLFKFDEDIGGGMPIWLPNGARLRANLENLLHKAHLIRGYEPVRGPEILKSELWQVSGHGQCYGHSMYFTEIEDVEYGIKPMNCLSHIKIFDSDIRSYRDLPLKYYEFGTVHRHERSGVLHGLLRVREFTQDDAHIFCTEAQIKDVIFEVMSFVDGVMKLFGFEYSLELATKPAKAIGDDAFWEKATNAIKDALESNGLKYTIDEGGGAFYGPKIDVKITDCLKRKWQCGTVQVDLNLPERFNINYTDENNERVRPVMIHRAIIGSFERFIAILTEHFAGEFPTFIAPTPVAIIPISDDHLAYAKELQKDLRAIGVYSKIYDRNDSLNKKIRTAETSKTPLIVVLGDKEVETNELAIRDRRAKEQRVQNRADFINFLKEQINGAII